jgi:hypothetical protein
MDLRNELAAHYALVRSEDPEAEIEDVVAAVAERMGIDGETALAAESLASGDDVDVIRRFVYEVEFEAEFEDELQLRDKPAQE